MGDFKRNNKRSGGGNRFAGRFAGRGGSKSNMHKAICSKCSANCEVPFKPTGDKPIFCSNCFEQEGGKRGGANKFGGERRERGGFNYKQMHSVVCSDCGKDCQVPFKPATNKPLFCDDCFKRDSKSGGSKNNNSGEVVEQIKILNNKVDKLIELLSPKTKKVKIKKETITKKVVKVKKVTPKKKVATKKKAKK